jgi:hypothetical protein
MEYGNQLHCNIQIKLTKQPQWNQASNMNSKSQTQKKFKQKK